MPAATLNPAQLTAGLLRRCVARGARVFAPANAEHLSIDRERVVIGTAEGPCAIGTHAVFCTGYELPTVIAVPRRAEIKCTWAIATTRDTAFPRWMRDTVVWEASDPYLYLRATGDGRLIAGGEDEDATQAQHSVRGLHAKASRIAAKVRSLVPGLSFRVSHRWEGIFGTSTTGLPIIGPLPEWPRCYGVAGLGGNGITFSQVAAGVIARAIANQPSPDLELFGLRR
jgi:glycine/D-amino acid oxidase-like deaminating enzyme